jgi:pimeloyl-ACP methyl ester carboxylesterase
VSVPRATIPAAGLPTTVFIRTGGGGDRPMVDRGQHATAGGVAIVPGSGPAFQYARAGFAGVMVDGPHGGPRNVSGGDEQLVMFNWFNAGALRDNVRQSALEIVLLAHVLETLSFDATACPGARTASGTAKVSFDMGRLALMGHSMGATIAPLVLANEPQFGAVILSGSGASWIENVIHKIKPIAVRPVAEVLIGYSATGRSLTAEDPVLSLVQWAAEPADSQVYARQIIQDPAAGESPRHVLMFQGLVDRYILPRIANAMSLSLGLDLAGETFDSTAQTGLAEQTPLAEVISYVGHRRISLPAGGNLGGGKVTAVVVQHPEDGIEDGHEIAYQSQTARREYRCFLESFAKGTPRVPAPSARDACE